MRSVLGVLLGFGLAVCGAMAACAGEMRALRGPTHEPARAEPPPNRAMTFRLGRRAGSPDCGLDCAEFIVAEGEIRRDSAEALAIVASRLKRPLPVVFHSPGGSLDGGLALGRALRHYRLNALVARLEPVPGAPAGGIPPYRPALHPAYCNSACVYTFAGGVARSVEPGSNLGIHRFYLAHASDPKRKPLTRYSQADSAKLDRSVKDLAFYLAEMGIDSSLLSMASQVEPSSVRYLDRAVMDSLGLTTPRPALDLAREEESQPLPPVTTRIGAVAAAAPRSWPLVRREGKPFAVLAMPTESRRYGTMTAEVAIGCAADGSSYEANIREIVSGRPAPRQDARMRIGATAPASTGTISRDLALGAHKTGVLTLEVVSTATAGHPVRLDFPAEGLASAMAELDRACGRR